MLRKLMMAAATIVLLNGAAATAATADEIIAAQWGATLDSAPLAVALELGYFEEAGVEISGIIPSEGGGTAVRNLLAAGDEAGYATLSLSAAVDAINNGLDIKIVNVEAHSAGDTVLIALPDSEVNSLADLEGKKVAITRPLGWAEMFAVFAIEHGQLPADSIERVALGSLGAAVTGLNDGVVEAAPFLEPYLSMKPGAYKVIFDGAELPHLVRGVGVATTDYIENNPEKLKAILKARLKGLEKIQADPASAAAAIAKHFPRVPEEALAVALKALAEKDFWSTTGAFEIEAMDRLLEGLRSIGAMEGQADWDTMLDDSFIPEG